MAISIHTIIILCILSNKIHDFVRVFDVMETIDDDCDDMDVVFVAVKV